MAASFRYMSALFYILYSASADRYYIGHTCDHIEERISKHNTHHGGFTGKFRDWELVYREEYTTKELAYTRERQVKKWKSARRVRELIHRSEHPDS